MNYLEINAHYHGNDVKGKILELTRAYIKVEITSPYINWQNELIKSGPALQNPLNSFLLTYTETAAKLLIESYRKLKCIDNSLERICKVHDKMLLELAEVEKIEDIDIRNSIISKLNDWFFDMIYTSSVTGLKAGIIERQKIMDIIYVFKSEGRKIYLSK